MIYFPPPINPPRATQCITHAFPLYFRYWRIIWSPGVTTSHAARASLGLKTERTGIWSTRTVTDNFVQGNNVEGGALYSKRQVRPAEVNNALKCHAHTHFTHTHTQRTHIQHTGGSRVLEAVIHYPHDCIPGLDKRSYRHHHSEASSIEVKRDSSRFSNKMPPPDNLSTIPTCPNAFTNHRERGREERRAKKAEWEEKVRGGKHKREIVH